MSDFPVAGFNRPQDLYEFASDCGLHAGSMDKLTRFAIALQSAALAQFIAGDGKEWALQRMHENEGELGLDQQFWDTTK